MAGDAKSSAISMVQARERQLSTDDALTPVSLSDPQT